MRTVLFISLLLAAMHASPHDVYKGTVVYVLDGDTVDVTIDLWPNLTLKERVRIYGVDTPEKRTRRACEKVDGLRATAMVETLLPVGSEFELEVVGFGKFGRPLGNIRNAAGLDIGASLINAGLAYPYFGEKKKEWECSTEE